MPSYYRQISGARMDRNLLNAFARSVAKPRDGRVSAGDVQTELKSRIDDGRGLTEVEVDTIRHGVAEYNVTAKGQRELAVLVQQLAGASPAQVQQVAQDLAAKLQESAKEKARVGPDERVGQQHVAAERAALASNTEVSPALDDGPRIKRSSLGAYVRSSSYKIVGRGRKSYGEMDPARAKANLPPDLFRLFESLQKERGRVPSPNELERAFEEYAAKLLEGLPDDYAFTALPPSLREVLREAQDFAIYSDRANRARAGEPFPDGVVDDNFVFTHYFGSLGKTMMRDLMKDFPILDQLAKLKGELRGGPKTIGGVTVRLLDDIEHAGKKLTAFRSDGPYVVFGEGNEALAVSIDKDGLYPKVSMHRFGDVTSSTLQDTETHLEWRPDFSNLDLDNFDFDAFREQSAKMPPDGFDLDGTPDVEGFAKLGRWLDALYADGANQAKISAGDVAAERTRVTAEYLARMGSGSGAVAMFQEIASLVPAFDDIALGDADLYIEIADKLTDTYYDDNDDEQTRTLIKGKGPLLTFRNAASGASFAVQLDALKHGRLEVDRFYDGASTGRVSLDAEMKAMSPIDPAGIRSFVFEIDWALADLRAMKAEQAAAQATQP
jgi:hypothetical protein